MTEARFVICPTSQVHDRAEDLGTLGVGPLSDVISAGILTATAETDWVGVEALPLGQTFNLRSWDQPVEREPGWHSFDHADWVCNALDLTAFRVER